MSEELLVSVEDGIMTMTMNRPQAKNAMNKSMSHAIAEAVDRFEADADIRVAILTGAGGTFCSGMDLKGFLAGETPVVKGRGFAGLTQYSPAKPLIAAAEGFALAGGFELLLSCDLVVATETTKFGIPEVKRSLIAGAGGVFRLPQQIPPRIAMELALSGDHYDAKRMYEVASLTRLCQKAKPLRAPKNLQRVSLQWPTCNRGD